MKYNENIKLLPVTVDAAILLGIITALGYECTFLYEKSFCEYFSIPGDFINVDLNSVVPYWTQTINIILLSLVASVGYYKLDSWLKKWSVIARFTSWNFLMLMACYITSLTSIDFKGQNNFFLVIMILTNLVVGLISIRNKYFKKQTKSLTDKETNSDLQTMKFYKLVRLAVFGIVILFVVLNLNLSQIRGKRDAALKHQFLTLKDTSSLVIIRVYSDRLICKGYDYKNKKFTDVIRVIRFSENIPLIMIPKELKLIRKY